MFIVLTDGSYTKGLHQVMPSSTIVAAHLNKFINLIKNIVCMAMWSNV